jgi:hypothetical protein
MCDDEFGLSGYNTSCSQIFCTTFANASDLFRGEYFYWQYLQAACYYCKSPNRQEFIKNLDAGNCPYFWKHDPRYCRDADETDENLTLRDDLYKLLPLYLKYISKKNSSLVIPKNYGLDFVLNLTVIRNANNDHIGERERGEIMYMCYCPTSKRWGRECDSYTRILTPFNVETVPPLLLTLKAVFGIGFLLIVAIPKNVESVKRNKRTGKSIIRSILLGIFANLDTLSAISVVIGIFFSTLREILMATSEYNVAAIFNIISYVLLGIALELLLVQWSHIYDSANEMVMNGPLSPKNKIILGVMLTLLGLLLLVAIVGTIVGVNVPKEPNVQVYNDYYNYFNGALYLLACVFIGGFAVGFLFYGLSMFRILRKVDSSLSILQLRVTRMMIVVDLTFLHFMFWLIIQSAIFFNNYAMGKFLDLFVQLFLQFSMFISFTAIGLLLFSPADFRKTYMCK